MFDGLRPLATALVIACSIAGSIPARGETIPARAAVPADRTLDAVTDRLVRQRIADTRTPGVAVAIVRDGRIVLLRGYGSADPARHIPVDPSRTLFRIGSVTKLFTYTLVLQLAEQGRLDLDRDLNAYLGAGTIPATFAAPVTARAVMAHRTGFEDAVMYRLLQPDGAMPTAERFVRDHVPARVRPVGQATSYSNFAVSALGQAAARVARAPYPDLVQSRILAPLGMTSTAVAEPPVVGRAQPFGAMAPDLAARMSIGHAPAGGRMQPVAYEHIYPAAAPAGSMSSTAADIARFMIAWLNDGSVNGRRILQPETIAATRRRSYPDRPGAPDFAGGWTNAAIAGHPAYWHSGAVSGFRAFLAIIPDLKLGVFVAANSDTWGTKPDLIRALVADVTGAVPSAVQPSVEVDPANYAGEYLTSRRSYTRLETLLALDATARVSDAGGGRIRIISPDGDSVWSPLTPTLFAPPSGEDRIAFDRDASGKATRFYAPNGLRFYERIGWAQRPVTLHGALIAAALAALVVMAFTRRLVGKRRWILTATALAGLALPLAFVAARSSFADVDPASWPGLPFRALVTCGWLAVAAAPTALGLAVIARTWPARLAITAHAVSFAMATYLLSQWGIFGGVFN